MLVESVTRLGEEEFRIDVDLGPEVDGSLVQYLRIAPAISSVSGGSHSSGFQVESGLQGQATFFELRFTPRGRYLNVIFSDPMVLVQGPWEIELPVR